MKSLEVLFAPAEFAALSQRDLTETVCVVFDILRATSTMVTALHNGAEGLVPVEEIAEALTLRRQRPGILLAGERDGVRIQAHLTGGAAFDLGNSPREFTKERIGGKTIAITTTNGTRALRACARARAVLAGSFLNLRATADFLAQLSPPNLLLVCSGTHDQAAYEDALCAGALCDMLWSHCGAARVADSAHMVRKLFGLEHDNLPRAFSQTRNGARLMMLPDLRDDVPFCAQRDVFPLVAVLEKDGVVRRRGDSEILAPFPR
jgi:2-phosphosulfolactate phosphatase